MRFPLKLSVALVLLLVSVIQVFGQADQNATIKRQTSLVLVPVVVRDKHDQHVSGLTAKDFALEDNGKAQDIASVEEVKADTTVVPPPQTPAYVAVPEFANWDRPKNITIIALDLVNTPILDVQRARMGVLKYLAEHISDSSMVALVAIEPGRVRLLHSFTSSPEILTAALQKVTGITSLADTGPKAPGYTPPTGIMQPAGSTMTTAGINEIAVTANSIGELLREAKASMEGASHDLSIARRNQGIASTLESLQIIASWVGGIPGRKSLVWITGQIPFVTGQGQLSLGNISKEDWERTTKLLADANTALYPVDVRGLIGFEWDRAPNSSLAFDSSATGIANRSRALQEAAMPVDDNHGAMDYLAKMTGGKAYYNDNNIPKMLNEAADDSSSYYMLSFYLDRSHAKKGWHKLSVKVDRSGLNVRSRTGFMLADLKEEKASVREATEQFALQSPFNYSSVPFTVRLPGPDPKAKAPAGRFEVNLPGGAVLGDEPNPELLSVDVLASATDASGKVIGRIGRAVRHELTPKDVSQIEQYGVTYVDSIKVPPGEYALRVVVRNNLSGRIGSITTPLTVR